MNRLTSLTPAEKKFLEDALFSAERAFGKKLSAEHKRAVIRNAREQIVRERYAADQRSLREKERHSVEFVWSRPKPFRR